MPSPFTSNAPEPDERRDELCDILKSAQSTVGIERALEIYREVGRAANGWIVDCLDEGRSSPRELRQILKNISTLSRQSGILLVCVADWAISIELECFNQEEVRPNLDSLWRAVCRSMSDSCSATHEIKQACESSLKVKIDRFLNTSAFAELSSTAQCGIRALHIVTTMERNSVIAGLELLNSKSVSLLPAQQLRELVSQVSDLFAIAAQVDQDLFFDFISSRYPPIQNYPYAYEIGIAFGADLDEPQKTIAQLVSVLSSAQSAFTIRFCAGALGALAPRFDFQSLAEVFMSEMETDRQQDLSVWAARAEIVARCHLGRNNHARLRAQLAPRLADAPSSQAKWLEVFKLSSTLLVGAPFSNEMKLLEKACLTSTTRRHFVRKIVAIGEELEINQDLTNRNYQALLDSIEIYGDPELFHLAARNLEICLRQGLLPTDVDDEAPGAQMNDDFSQLYSLLLDFPPYNCAVASFLFPDAQRKLDLLLA